MSLLALEANGVGEGGSISQAMAFCPAILVAKYTKRPPVSLFEILWASRRIGTVSISLSS